MRPARRQLRQREGRRASWVPQAIQSASQPRSANVSSNRGLAGGRAAGWLRCEAIDFSPGRGPSPLLIRPMRVAGFPELSASTILPCLRRGRWSSARPHGWVCRSDLGLGPRRRAGRSPSGREGPDQRQAEDSLVGAESGGRRRTDSRRPLGRAGRRSSTPASGPGTAVRCRSRRGCDSSCLRSARLRRGASSGRSWRWPKCCRRRRFSPNPGRDDWW
jgi:hypothetical protein